MQKWKDWKILKIVKKGDYLYAVVPDHPKATVNGYVLEHRIVMENFIGRTLNSNEVVHHINKDRHDNRIENLLLLDENEHSKLHAKEKHDRVIEVILKCKNCDKEFTLTKREYNSKIKNNKNIFCSRRCNGLYGVKNIVGFLPNNKKDNNHGINMYRYGCRCDVCRKANTDKHKKYRAKKLEEKIES